MRKLFLAMVFVLIFCGIGLASPYLACDIPTDPIVVSEVEVDGAVVPSIWQLSTDGTVMLLLDLAGFPTGRHIFRVRVQDASGWWSDWSSPLDAGKPGVPGNVKVVNE